MLIDLDLGSLLYSRLKLPAFYFQLTKLQHVI